jgi:hypothetical protein
MTFGGVPTRYLLDEAALARMPTSKGASGEIELVDISPHKRVLFLLDRGDAVTLWQQPEREPCAYVIGACWSSKGAMALVIDQRNGHQVAMLHSDQGAPAEFVARLARLGRFYNWAFLVPQINEGDFRDALRLSDYPPCRIFSRPRNHMMGLPEDVGFEMTDVSRAQIIHTLQEAVLRNAIAFRSQLVIEACRAFVTKPDGRSGVEAGPRESYVWAAALAAVGLQSAPRLESRGHTYLKGFGPPRRER